jgi:trehalose transport system substrate-binding protein
MALRWTLILLLGLTGGCGLGPPPDGGELTVLMGLAEVEWRVMRERVFLPFEQQHRVRIRGVQAEAADAAKKLVAMHRAKRMEVDLITQDVLHLAPLVSAGVMEDLSPFREVMPTTTLPHLVEVGTFDGRLYFMPYRPNVQIAYYHADKFSAYELQPPQTWDKLLTVAKRFREAEGVGRVLLQGTLSPNTTTQVIEFIWAADGDPLVLNDRGSVQAFTFLQQLAPYLAPETRRADWNTTNAFLATEAVYLARNWPFGVHLLVQVAGKTQVKAYHGWRGPVREAHVLGGEVIGIPKGTEQRDLALALLRYLMSRPVQEILVSNLGWPSFRSDAYGSVHSWQAPYFAAVQEALEQAQPRPHVSYWAQLERALTGAFREIVYEDHPVQATLDRYHRELRRARQLGR